MNTIKSRFQSCGREFTQEELSLIQEIVEDCSNLTRTELAGTVCELLDWKRPSGRLKKHECRGFLENLEVAGVISLPEKKNSIKGKNTKPTMPLNGAQPWSKLSGNIEDFAPVDVELVENPKQGELFQGLIQGYHYLGYSMPYGARLQYLAYVNKPSRQVVGCIQFSSPAWRMKARDRWIGWDDTTRSQNLQHVVNNSRFLVLPKIRNLSSMLLSLVLKRLRSDWQLHYGLEPWLAETLVDPQRYHGGCYRAANWLDLGETSGRGRMDQLHQRHGAQVKTVLIYPLVRKAATRLRQRRVEQ